MHTKGITAWIILFVLIAACSNPKTNTGTTGNVDPAIVENPSTASSPTKLREMAPVISLQDSIHDFGTIMQGEKVSFALPFTNTGKSDLLINAATASCGCTVADYPKDPVKPGATGILNISFDSKGKHGYQNKVVTILSNTVPNTKQIFVRATVEDPNDHH